MLFIKETYRISEVGIEAGSQIEKRWANEEESVIRLRRTVPLDFFNINGRG